MDSRRKSFFPTSIINLNPPEDLKPENSMNDFAFVLKILLTFCLCKNLTKYVNFHETLIPLLFCVHTLTLNS